MIGFIIRTFIVIISIAFLIKQLRFQKWFNQSLHEKYGISQVEEFGLSYKNNGREHPLVFTMDDMRICTDHIVKTSRRSILQRFVMDRIPVHAFLAKLASGSALQIKRLVLDRDNVSIVLSDVWIQTDLKQDLITILVKTGPVQLTVYHAALSGNITTDSSASFSYDLQSNKPLLKDVDVQVGKIIFDKPESVDFFSANAGRWIKDLSTVRVTVDSVDFQGDS